MINAEIRHNLIVYNKNPTGYIKGSIATVDNMFKNEELSQWLQNKNLEIKWEDGIFEKLVVNQKYYETEGIEPLKSIRIWQLKRDFDVECRFVSYDEMIERQGEVNIENYIIVFDGELPTNNLEEIYSICNINHPKGYVGHSLSMSDIVELYSEIESGFYYVDRFGFKEVEFDVKEQVQNLGTQSM